MAEPHDVMKSLNECVCFPSHHREVLIFVESSSTNPESYPAGSIFLSLRKRKKSVVELMGRTLTKISEEIVLSPDGRIGILEEGFQKRKIA